MNLEMWCNTNISVVYILSCTDHMNAAPRTQLWKEPFDAWSIYDCIIQEYV